MIEIPRWRLESWMEHMSDPGKWAHMLKENSRHIRDQLERHDKAAQREARNTAVRPPTGNQRGT